jgi:membrane-bound metal-dependent hydrolase YbcI (DUF457 family)
MLIFGHTGITLGMVMLLNGALTRRYSLKQQETSKHIGYSAHFLPEQVRSKGSRLSSFVKNHLDIRLLVIGSLLPDIIDKPVGQFFFRQTYSNGRIFCHTLLFLIVIILAGYCLYRVRRKTWLIVLSVGTFSHLVLDQMWLDYRTLLWPAYGLAFKKLDLTHWVQQQFYHLGADPTTYVPEIIGLVILSVFVVELVRRRRVGSFIRNGQLR